MPKKDEHREPIHQRKKINLNPSMSDTINGLVEKYDEVDRRRTEEMKKSKKEQDIEKIKKQTEILNGLERILKGKGCDVKAEVKKLRESRVR